MEQKSNILIRNKIMSIIKEKKIIIRDSNYTLVK